MAVIFTTTSKSQYQFDSNTMTLSGTKINGVVKVKKAGPIMVGDRANFELETGETLSTSPVQGAAILS